MRNFGNWIGIEKSLVTANNSQTTVCILSGNNSKYKLDNATKNDATRNNGITLKLPIVTFLPACPPACLLCLSVVTISLRTQTVSKSFEYLPSGNVFALLAGNQSALRPHLLMSFVRQREREMRAAVDLPLTTTAVSVYPAIHSAIPRHVS